jgi:hypothetical protein
MLFIGEEFEWTRDEIENRGAVVFYSKHRCPRCDQFIHYRFTNMNHTFTILQNVEKQSMILRLLECNEPL